MSEKTQGIKKATELDSNCIFVSSSGLDGLNMVSKKIQKQVI